MSESPAEAAPARWHRDPGGPQGDPPLRRAGGGARGRPLRRPGPDHRADRAQRGRQDHLLQLHHRPVRPQRGRRPVRGQADQRPAPDRITKLGIARTFQNLRLFANMTARENVLVGRHCRTREGVISSVVRGPRFRREERESFERATELLEFVGLAGKDDELARNLPYGDMRRLEIARRPGHRAQAGPAGRADGRHEPAGDGQGGRAGAAHPLPGPVDRGHRARHEVPDGDLGPGDRARPRRSWPRACRGRSSATPRSSRPTSVRRRRRWTRRCWTSRTSTSSTATSRPSRACRSMSTGARSSP